LPQQIWVTKPDGKAGWAPYFLSQGYSVYTANLPSAEGDGGGLHSTADYSVTPVPSYLEQNLTAPARFPNDAWPGRTKHSQWPGSGLRGDKVFDTYFNSLKPKCLTDIEREAWAMASIKELMDKLTGPAILLGEGFGGNIAYAVADMLGPESVKGVIAIEPDGPPFGSAYDLVEKKWMGKFVRDFSERPYGITSMPLAYNPATLLRITEPGVYIEPIPVSLTSVQVQGQKRTCFTQNPDFVKENTEMLAKLGILVENPVRQLTNLKGIPQLIVTGEASFHALFDWATVHFLKQAGCAKLRHLQLGGQGNKITGNGHLMFLEKNSNAVAAEITKWIGSRHGVPSKLARIRKSSLTKQVANVDKQFVRSEARDTQGLGVLSPDQDPRQAHIELQLTRIKEMASSSTVMELAMELLHTAECTGQPFPTHAMPSDVPIQFQQTTESQENPEPAVGYPVSPQYLYQPNSPLTVPVLVDYEFQHIRAHQEQIRRLSMSSKTSIQGTVPFSPLPPVLKLQQTPTRPQVYHGRSPVQGLPQRYLYPSSSPMSGFSPCQNSPCQNLPRKPAPGGGSPHFAVNYALDQIEVLPAVMAAAPGCPALHTSPPNHQQISIQIRGNLTRN
jgi:hypothetical protein